MASNSKTVRRLLTELQRQARVTTDGHGAMTFRLPSDLARSDATHLVVSEDVVDVMRRAGEALSNDPCFEYMDGTTAKLQDFIARAWFDRKSDHVQQFILNHAHDLLELVCFIPIEHLSIETPMKLLELQILPITHPTIPTAGNSWFKLAPPVGSVAAIPVRGTNLAKMAERAQAQVAHALRVARVGLRDLNGMNDRQLRFRGGDAYAFSNDSAGWCSRSDIAYELALSPSSFDSFSHRPVWAMPVSPTTDIEKKADLALRWMERSRFTGEPLIALLYLFFALEALLGDKSEGLKANMLAFRQLVLSHVVTGGFREPNTTWLLYEAVRNAAVHGEEPPPVNDQMVSNLEWAVRDTLNEYLIFANSQNVHRRGKLIQKLTSHPDVPQLVDWIRTHAGAGWAAYLNKVLPQDRSSAEDDLEAGPLPMRDTEPRGEFDA